MGGCTLSAIRATREEAMKATKELIIDAAGRGLWPDSELIVLAEGSKEAEIYAVELIEDRSSDDPTPHEVRFNQVSAGRAFHIGVAAKFNRAMKPGEWIATVHVHT